MSRVYVCPLSRLRQTVRRSGARTLLTLINKDTAVTRPEAIERDRHLFLAMSDIVVDEDGHILPADSHVEDLLAFVRRWDQTAPLLIHCYAGVSRSTAAAYITACALAPERAEAEIATTLRRASPTATPNSRLVAIADAVLGRKGRMIESIAAIGRGRECFEGIPFSLEI